VVQGKCLLWDPTCSDTLAKSYISSTSCAAGAAALNAEKRKHKKYEGVANLYKFVPFAVETLCPFGEEALDLVKDLRQTPDRKLSTAQVTGISHSKYQYFYPTGQRNWGQTNWVTV
jgi:hypothetical protein